MTSSEKKILSDYIDEKIDLLVEYEEASKPIPEAEFEDIGECLDRRTDIMDELKEVTEKENSVISSLEERKALESIFRLVGLDKTYDGEIEELAVKLRSQKILFSRIEKLEEEIVKRLEDEKRQLDKDLLQISKSKQVIDYMEQTAKPVIFNGGSFDKSL